MRTNTGQILYIPKIGQRANLQHPLMRGCVGWWPLTDGAGGIAKDLVRGNNGIQSGGVTWADTEKGRAASFDGSTGYFQHSNILARSFTDAFSVSFWARPDSDTSDQRAISNWYVSGPTNAQWIVWYDVGDGAKGWTAVVKDSGGTDNFAGNTTNSGAINEWQHVCATWSSSSTDILVYVDGVEVASGTSASMQSSTSSTSFQIGRLPNLTQFFDGDISNVRVWDRALSSSEVFELYINPWSGLSIPSSTRYFYFPTTLPLSETLGTFKMRNLSFAPRGGGRTIIRKPS